MKKRILSIFTAAVMVFSSLTAVHCSDGIKVILDGQEIEFDVPPQIIDDRTMVPMRRIFEAMGAEVDWDDTTNTVHANRLDEYGMNTYVIMQIGSNTFVKGVADTEMTRDVSVEEITLDVSPQIIDDRTLVPIRAVSEAFDCSVDWDDETQTVTITAAPSAEPTAAPSAEPTAAPSAEPTAAPAADAIPIEYDNTNELQAHYMRDFEILSLEKNAEGNYDITYRLRTFLEGKGTVSVSFNCFSESGALIDTFGGGYIGIDYTWSWHEDTATISGKTVKIELALTN